MPAAVHVRVPDSFDIDPWLRLAPQPYFDIRRVLAADTDLVVPSPVIELLNTARSAGFEWEWEPERRLLADAGSDLEVNYGLDDHFTDLAAALRATAWGYRFESAGKYELAGECWEWMPGWPAPRTLTLAGDTKALDADSLRAAFDEAAELGTDPVEHLATWLAPWPGWTTPPATIR